jgi:beta-glucosidase
MLRKVYFFYLFLSVFILPSDCQTTLTSSSATDARVESMLKQLTLEEKIDLIGGVDDFYIRANPKIGLPRLKMADGPVGVRNYGPSTVFGGIGLAATWDLNSRERWEPQSDKMRAPVACTSCSAPA